LDNDDAEPAWIKEVQIPTLSRVSFDGAIGKLIQGQFNSMDARDPLSGKKIGPKQDAANTEKHHIFPSKYLPGLEHWDKKQDTADVICNMMFVERDTNRKWINQNPSDHVKEALGGTSEPELKARYAAQFINDAAYAILKKAEKSKADFYTFLEARQAAIREHLRQRYGFPLIELAVEEDLDQEDPSDEVVPAPNTVA
jgi:hypothetical protein